MRNQNIELIRIIASFGIVVFHCHAFGGEFGYSGLISFVIISVYYSNNKLIKSSKKILIPWVFWSIIYCSFRFFVSGTPLIGGLGLFLSLMYGKHLWFLPFIFVVNFCVSLVNWKRFPIFCAVSSFVIFAFTPWLRELQLAAAPPFAQYLHALPAALIGVALRDRRALLISVATLAVCFLWGVPGVSLPYAIGGSAVIAGLQLPSIKLRVESISSSMQGVYLIHLAIIALLNRFFIPSHIMTALAVFVISLIIVEFSRRYVPFAKIVLG